MNAQRTQTIRFSRTLLATVALGGLAACGGGDRPTADLAASQVTTIGVNSYLWRAALDTVSFAPLLQTDSAGGVIVTDWYANPSNPNERVKVSVTILDQDLRADALRVAASRQVAQGGAWVDAPPLRDAFVVNVGDMLHRMSNGRLLSTPHRVINTSGRERYSVPFFFDPHVSTVITPLPGTGTPRFPPLHFGDFLHAELEAGYDAHKGPSGTT